MKLLEYQQEFLPDGAVGGRGLPREGLTSGGTPTTPGGIASPGVPPPAPPGGLPCDREPLRPGGELRTWKRMDRSHPTAHYRLVRSIFETTDTLRGQHLSTTRPPGPWRWRTGCPHAELRSVPPAGGSPVTAFPVAPNPTVARSDYAYLLDWSDTHAPRALYWLQAQGLRVEVATQPGTLRTLNGPVTHVRGYHLAFPFRVQPLSPDSVHRLVQEAARRTGVPSTGSSPGVRPGGGWIWGAASSVRWSGPASSSWPRGRGDPVRTSWTPRVEVPVTRIENSSFSRADLTRYNVIAWCRPVGSRHPQRDSRG